MLELAERISRLAEAGKIVRLKPETSLLCQWALLAIANAPTRPQLVTIICGSKERCAGRGDCYECFGKANAIMRLYEGESIEPIDVSHGLKRRR